MNIQKNTYAIRKFPNKVVRFLRNADRFDIYLEISDTSSESEYPDIELMITATIHSSEVVVNLDYYDKEDIREAFEKRNDGSFSLYNLMEENEKFFNTVVEFENDIDSSNDIRTETQEEIFAYLPERAKLLIEIEQ